MSKPKQKTAQWKLKGDCSIYESTEIHKKLQTMLHTAATVTLDLSAVEKLDASFVQLLIAAKKQAFKHDVQLRINKPTEAVRSLVEALHCQQVLVEDSESVKKEVNHNES